MAYGTFTPARRAALRKAQLASAAKRRKYGVGYQASRTVRQKAGYFGASASVARRHVGQKGFSPRTKKALKYTAIAGAAGVGIAGGVYANRNTIGTAAGNLGRGMVSKGSRMSLDANNRQFDRHLRTIRYTGHDPKYKKYTVHYPSTRGKSSSFFPPPHALGTGPKGKSALRSRKYRASGGKVGAAYRRSDRNAAMLKNSFTNKNLRRAYYGK